MLDIGKKWLHLYGTSLIAFHEGGDAFGSSIRVGYRVGHHTEWGGEENEALRPHWAGGAVQPAMRGVVDGGCWVGHPTEWGGEEN